MNLDMMWDLREKSCYPEAVVGVNVGLACIDGVIAFLAFYQLLRIHSRNPQISWTRQKVFHIMIGSSNLGYFLYFVLTLVAACKGWTCWSHSCGFFFMAFPKILFVAAFLLLLSFWVDLCHQSNDDDEDEECSPLLEKMNVTNSNPDGRRRCFTFWSIHIGSRQKVVILVTVIVFSIMVASAVLIRLGMGKNPIDSSVVAQVYVDLMAISVLLLGGALACYGLMLFLKMKKVRSERASSEMWKVASLASVSVIGFISSALVAICTNIPLFYHWHEQTDGVYTSLLLVTYYFIGTSVPSAFVLLVMRELPPLLVINNREQESSTTIFITDSPVAPNQTRWVAATSSQNKVSRASPI